MRAVGRWVRSGFGGSDKEREGGSSEEERWGVRVAYLCVSRRRRVKNKPSRRPNRMLTFAPRCGLELGRFMEGWIGLYVSDRNMFSKLFG